ncbi:glycosyltransferase, partial [Pimelobacter simplex]|uniref:glycosyltransferase n=1 Tax=Nocardioides simplex TaxID=2045 RepID=UPI0027DF16B8
MDGGDQEDHPGPLVRLVAVALQDRPQAPQRATTHAHSEPDKVRPVADASKTFPALLSVVVPCYNEEAVVDALVAVLKDVLPEVAASFEVLLVDDGSSDGTLDRLRAINADDPRFRYLALSRNFGKESAMLAGLSLAKGDAVAILDADLQHPP